MSDGSKIAGAPGSVPPTAALGTTGELRQLGAGTQLGRFTLLRRIAAGGMAEVYVARSRGVSGFEKKVAIKKILPQFSLNQRFIEMLVDEAKITVRLAHPNIAQVHELGLEDDTYYIVMEYVDGRPLNRLLQKVDARGYATMPVEHAVHIVAEVAKGLHHAHNQRDLRGQPLSIVHRDVSPQNILVSYAGDVKLIDFGIARAAGKASQTTVGTIKGKLRYLAPEIARGLEPDHRADVFCCGIVLFELLTGEALFAPRTDVEAIELATEARIRSPRIANPAVPRELEEILFRALEKDRDRRTPTAKALATELRRFLNAHAPSYVGSELGDYMHALFAAELDEDAKLDALAEEVAVRDLRAAGVDVGGSEPSLELPKAERSRSGGYREIVTRAEVALVGTGEIEALDDSDEEGATQAGAPPRPRRATGDEQPTQPGAARAPSDGRGAGATRVRSPDRASETASAGAASPRAAPLVRVLLGVAAAGVALGLGWVALFERGDPPPAPEVSAAAGPIEPALGGRPGSASLRLEVTPDVPIDVRARGRLVLQSARPPLVVPMDVSPGEEVEVELVSRGYAPRRVRHVMSPDNAAELTITLEPLPATLVLAGLDAQAKLEIDRGSLDGDRVVGLRFGEVVHLRVSRAGLRDVELTVNVDDVDPIRVEITRGEPVPTGRLSVAARPFADVLVNGRSLGRTPVNKALPVGSYRLVLRREGGEHRYDVVIRAGQTSTILHQWPR